MGEEEEMISCRTGKTRLVLPLLFTLFLLSISQIFLASAADYSWADIDRVGFAHNEVDLIVNYIKFNSTTPFKVMIWTYSHPLPSIYYKEGESSLVNGSYTYTIQHQRINSTLMMPTISSLILFPGVELWRVNIMPFPYQEYTIEVVYGFNVSSVTAPLEQRSGILGELWKEGRWNLTQKMEKSSIDNPMIRKHMDVIQKNGINYFLSWKVVLRHTDSYKEKMFVYIFGPIILSFIMYLGHLVLTYLRRLTISDHLNFVVAYSVFLLGSMLSVRELMPPVLTVSEVLANFLTGIYIVSAFIIIGKRVRIRSERNEGGFR